MVNKPSADRLIDDFQSQIDELYQHIDAVLWVWDDRSRAARAGLSALNNRNLQRVYESSLVDAVVSWQLFATDWFRTALACDASVLRIKLADAQRRPELKIGDVKVFPEMKPLTLHPTKKDIADVLEAPGQFFDVNSQKTWKAYSKLLGPEFATRAERLSTDDFLIVELCRRLRNASAHRSKSSMGNVREILTGEQLTNFDLRHGKVSLSLTQGVSAKGIGRYLASEMHNPYGPGRQNTRLAYLIGTLKRMSDKLR